MRQLPRFEPGPYRAALLALATVGASAGCGDPPVAPEEAQVSSAPALQATSALSFRQISTGMYHSCGVTFDNLAYCWGADGVGQLGDGAVNTSFRSRPVAVKGDLHFQMVSAGFDHTCGVTTQDQVYCWGSNSRGQLGDGSFSDHTTPVPVAGQLRFSFVSAGYIHTCAIHLQGGAFCWGNNGNGRLGDGTTTERLTPTPVFGVLQFRRIAAGGFHTCGVTTDSHAYCWGRNEQGQLGDGSLSSRHKPVPVAAGTRSFRWVTTNSANISFKWQSATCGISGGGQAYCWGSNLHGQLGDGSHTQHTMPVAVKGGLSFAQVNTGGGHTCGVTTSNLVYCWGYNGRGQLGDGTLTDRTTPRAVTGHLFRAVPTAGGYAGGHTCGLTTGDAAFCWGYNGFGQVGDGSTTDRRVPTAVLGPS